MKIKSHLYFALIIFSVALVGCAPPENAPTKNASEQEIIFVKIPPVQDEKLSREERFWQFQKFLFPQITIPDPIPKALPNDDSILFVSLEEDGTIKINSQSSGDLQNTDALKNKLTEIFQERAERNVFEPFSDKIVKAVLIIAPASSKYGDVFKVIKAVNQSGADPIVLKIKELPTARTAETK